MAKTIELWIGEEKEPEKLGTVASDSYREAVLALLEHDADLDHSTLLYRGLHIYETKDAAIADWEYRNNVRVETTKQGWLEPTKETRKRKTVKR